MLRFVLGHRQLWANVFHLDSVALFDALTQFERFGKLVASLKIENPHVGLYVGEHMDDATALGAKRSRHSQTWMKLGNRPAQHGLGSSPV